MKKTFPISRYVYYGDFRYYYAFGNTPAEDLLRSCQPGESIPSILLLGCGDLRSCFYTLWKNFRSGTSMQFDGVHFDLNDCSSAIIARDILFLQLCLKMPQESESTLKNWISALWAIWFCHELYQAHFDILKHNLRELIVLSRSPAVWSSTNNPLAKIVQFSSPATFEAVRQNWIMWSNENVAVKSVKHMNRDRREEQMYKILDKKQFAKKIIDHIAQPLTCFDKNLMESEILHYLEYGSAFVEYITGDTPASSETFINLTFYERKDGKYSLHYESIPYRCFFHSHQFSPEHIRSSIAKSTKTASTFLVNDSSFNSNPLLSNSVQQFALWMRSSALVLQNAVLSPSEIMFTFHHSDAIEHCLNLQISSKLPRKVARYDLIYTSNLIDHLTPTNLILAAFPLVKQEGYIFTTSLKYRSITHSPEEYLRLLFGMDTKLLPIILGVRCIDHEGIGYSSEISVEPVLPHDRMIIWERVCRSLPLKHPSLLENSPSIVDALCSVFCNATPSLLIEHESGRQEFNLLCTETVMHILHAFTERVECETKDHHFWKPLSSLLLQKSVLKPYLHCIQTHSFLHGFHLHLVVDEEMCPICKSVPLTDYLGQFELDVNVEPYLRTPMFIVLIHNRSTIHELRKLSTPFSSHELLQIVYKKPCHTIDCINMSRTNGSLSMHFYMPASFLKMDYRITVFSFMVNALPMPGAPQYNLSTVVASEALTSVVRMESNYIFNTVNSNTSTPVLNNSFGILEFHTYDKDVFKTTIKLSDECVSSLKVAPLSPRMQCSSRIEMCAGLHKVVLPYPVPIHYDGLKIKVSKMNKTITVEAQRMSCDFHSGNLLFFANPYDKLTMFQTAIDDKVLAFYCCSQFTPNDLENVMSKGTDSLRGPLCRLQLTLSHVFQNQIDNVFVLNYDQEVSVFVIVEARLFDLEANSPCIHIAYSFPQSLLKGEMLQILQKLDHSNIKFLDGHESQVQLMEKMLSYFTLRTIIHSESDIPVGGVLHQMRKHSIFDHFSQAVVYPLYPTHTHKSRPLNPTVEVPTFQCLSCGVSKRNLKTCKGCGNAKYCGKECQTKHWKIHKEECKYVQTKDHQPQDGTENSKKLFTPLGPNEGKIKSDSAQNQRQSKCSGCEKEHQLLRYCPCHEVAYCSQTCQRMDWVRHKTNCTKKK